MKVAVFGLGYVGTVTAACLAANGHDVWGVDVDAAKVAEIRAGRSPVAEPGLEALVAQAVAGGSLHATTSCAEALDEAEISLVCVGTPSTARGATDLSYIRRAVDDIADALRASLAARIRHAQRRHPQHRAAGHGRDVVVPALAGGLAGTQLTAGRRCARSSCGRAPASPTSSLRRWSWSAPPTRRSPTPSPSLFGFLDQPVQVVGRPGWPKPSSTPATRSTPPRCPSPTSCPGCSGCSAWIPARSCRCSARTRCSTSRQLPAAGLRLRRLLPARRTCGRCCTWPANSVDLPVAGGHAGDERAGDQRGRGPRGRLRRPHRRAARPELQDEHRRPAGEPERGAGRAARSARASTCASTTRSSIPARLVGANRRHVESKLPHLGRLLTREPGEALRGADVAIVSSRDQAIREALLGSPPPHLIDLSGRLGREVESLPGYEGIGW